MDLAPHLVFGPFRLDPINKHLWRGEEQLALRPMAGAVLLVLAENAGEIVTKDELFKRVWAGTYVTDTVLRVCIREIRQALEDSAQTPQYIETVGRRGYRFVGTPNRGKPLCSAPLETAESEPIVGRAQEVAQLQQWFLHAERGERQVVFITGEPGIGKTAVVDLFLDRVRATGLRIGHGQCLEHYGKGEAYLPILEALVRLSREPGGSRLIAVLSRYAPTWLMQMPALLNDKDLAQLQSRAQGTTPQRMLREMAEALEVLTVERPFILVLEDLHWSDDSTVALLSALAQRQERARLMVLGTYRPSDLASDHPLRTLKQELQLRNRCKVLPLNLLTEQDVTNYVAGQFSEYLVPKKLARTIYRRTEGNPLFMVNIVHTLTEQALHETDTCVWNNLTDSQKLSIPENLQQTIEQRVERLGPDERNILEAASVAGSEFTAATVAAAVGKKLIEVEERCRELVQRKQFIHTKGTVEWPDGTVTERYRFIHVLYQEVLYEQVTGGKRSQLHQQVGERIEQGYHNRRHEVATELALHFEQGRDFYRTVQYLGQAAENANQRCAYSGAIRHLEKALDLLKMFPNNSERAQREIMLQIALGMSLMATKGYTAPEVKSAYDRAQELCLQVGETPQLVLVLRGLSTFYYVRAELQTARTIAEQLIDLVQSQQDQTLLLQASYDMGGTLFNLGELPAAYQHLQRAMLFYDSHKQKSDTLLPSQDTGISCLARMSHSLWFLGYPDQALAKSQEALSLSQELALLHSSAFALNFAAGLHLFCREGQIAQQCAEEARRLSTEYEFPIWATMGQILGGSALVHQGMVEKGIHQIQDGMAAWRAIGAQISVPYFLSLLAEAYGKSGYPEKGLRVLTEALTFTNNTEERWWEAELYRLKGTLTLEARDWRLETRLSSQAPRLKPQLPNEVAQEAEECFLKALEVAQRQQAKSLELRAATSLAQLKQRQRKPHAALPILEEVYNWFTEGFGTADLQDAKLLLNELHEQSISGHLAALRTAKTKRKVAGTSHPASEPRVAHSVRG
jgi:DNA-binding winged helix-turn-helix (wHTH) protein/predicted ATPase